MVLIKSISGVRGTINQNFSDGLSKNEIIHCTNQFIDWLIQEYSTCNQLFRIVIGRDGRISGVTILDILLKKIQEKGVDVINLGLTTTPSVQLAIQTEGCVGGMMVSASHNPMNWNGLKLLNNKGEFLSKTQSLQVFSKSDFKKNISAKGQVFDLDYKAKHITSILNLKDINIDAVRKKKFKIVIDGINSSGSIYVPYLLNKLGVQVIKLNCNPNGDFAHDPEPLPRNLKTLCNRVKEEKADLGIAVDPDVDRLVFVCEDGSFFGEEYTIVAIAKYVLQKYSNASVVSNLSTTKAVMDIAKELKALHFESAVGEANVVELMKEKKSIIGGEGSGGIIFAPSHYGRDALVGIALFLTYLAESNYTLTYLKSSLPFYFMEKEKVVIPNNFNFKNYINNQIKLCKENNLDFLLIDGIKIYYDCGSWSHVRISNTEPIIRLIIESPTQDTAINLKSKLTKNIMTYL